MTIEGRLLHLVREALVAAAPGLGIEGPLPEPELMAPRQKEHGDFATNVALGLATRAGRPPRDVAQAIADALPDAPFLVKTEVAGPGFLNFFTTDEWLHEALREVVARGAAYGRPRPNGLRAQVEFVSANPTGPLHVGHARNAVLGDAIAGLLEWGGWSVEREYYFNDAGSQIDTFGASLRARARGEEVPEEGYTGDYMAELAAQIPGAAEMDASEVGAHGLREPGARSAPATTLPAIASPPSA